MKKTSIYLGLIALIISFDVRPQVFQVEQLEKSFFISEDPTFTYLYPSQTPRSILVFIPGGDGSVGVKKDWGSHSRYFSLYAFNRMLGSLANSQTTDGTTNVVIFDNPKSLGLGSSLPLRGGKDHLIRIESTIDFYKKRYNLPVILMGHSAGGVSVAEFLGYLAKNNKDHLVNGLIFSAGRNDSYFDEKYNIPALFFIHEDDTCGNTTPKRNKEIYERFKSRNSSVTEFQLISGGTSQGDPCTSGQHMYYGSESSVSSLISKFIKQSVLPSANTNFKN